MVALERAVAQKTKELKDRQKDEGQSLKEILEDKGNFELYGELLKQKGKTDLAEKLIENKIEPEDIKALTKYRNEFIKLSNETRESKEILNSFNLYEHIGVRSKEFKTLLESVGHQNLTQLIEKHMLRIAVQNPGEFTRFKKYLQTVKANYEKDAEITAIVNKYNLTDEELEAKLNIPSATERERQLKKLLESRTGWVQRWFGGKKQAYADIGDTLTKLDRVDTKAMLNEVEDSLTKLGKTLYDATSKNEEARKEFTSLIVGTEAEDTEAEEEQRASFKEARGMWAEKTDIGNAWSAHKQEVVEQLKKKGSKTVKKWDDVSAKMKNNERDKFIEAFTNKQVGRKVGVWAGLIRPMLKALVESVTTI